MMEKRVKQGQATEEEKLRSVSGQRVTLLAHCVTVLFVLQPLMDIFSFWLGELGQGNTVSLGLRFLVFFVVLLAGFLCASRKKYYMVAALVIGLMLAGHCGACLIAGYQAPFTDFTNFVRVIQMPAFAVCMISFLKYGERFKTGEENPIWEAAWNGLTINFWLISVSVLISVLTGTAAATYSYNGYGVLGWFATSNSQSAVMSVLSPIVILQAWRRKNYPYFILTTAAAYLQLYFMGPRLAFLTMVVVAVGFGLTLLLTGELKRQKNWRSAVRYLMIPVAAMVVCLAAVKMSPMYLNQQAYGDDMAQKQVWEGQMFEKAEAEAKVEENSAKADEKADTNKADEKKEESLAALRKIYEFYTPVMCKRFGTDTVMEKYGYTQTVTDLTATRRQKIVYCELLLEEHPAISRLFGMELGKMYFEDAIFDVENDFHGIFFLYGAVGLLLLLLFLGWFGLRILRCLVRNFKVYFTPEAAGTGMAFLLLLVYAYCTSGVLRRPNASFYLSAVLALVWYLTDRSREKNLPAESGSRTKTEEAENL